jgi:hypothetical protein
MRLTEFLQVITEISEELKREPNWDDIEVCIQESVDIGVGIQSFDAPIADVFIYFTKTGELRMGVSQ